MQALAGERLLTAWDQCLHESDLGRPLTLLAIASPERTRENLASLSLAELNLELWRLRQITFGEQLRATLPCPSCSAQVEFTLALPEVVKPLEGLLLSAGGVEKQWEGWRIAVKPVASNDVEIALRATNTGRAKQILLERCISLTTSSGTFARWDEAPLEVREFAMVLIEEVHDAAEFTCVTICPQCGAEEVNDLDIGRLLWFEVRSAAKHLLREVHELASAYGWGESVILAMSAQRRQVYLSMVRA